MYIRNLRKPSANKNVFKFASAKTKSTILCESSIEFDACFHHEYDENVLFYESQPKGYYYILDGQSRSYTPDALVKYRNGKLQFIEYKPSSKKSDVSFQREFTAKQKAAQKLGIQLILVTTEQIRITPLLDNLKLLHRYACSSVINEAQEILLHKVQSMKQIKLNELSDILKLSYGEVRANICLLLSLGLITADLYTESLSDNPTIRMRE